LINQLGTLLVRNVLVRSVLVVGSLLPLLGHLKLVAMGCMMPPPALPSLPALP